MTAEILDLGIIVLIVLSAIIGLIRGFVREALSLATWVAAFGFAILYVKPLSSQLPFAVQSEVVRMGIAFAIIFFGVLIIGAFINYLLSAAVASIGLGGVDHLLGGAFGVLRGGLIITLLVLLMGLTAYPKQAWWKDSILMPWFENTATVVRGMIPQDFSNYLERPVSAPAQP
ncbi:CvpA family protein [Thiothrix nivea]|uniref:Colicin V production protein n=1 Tax=Thiothrix nivea (strain ATCC 35100 / DSM 5205 / JP2) TaxID=870187 RepID=A0A656HC85_THINJ|nr:CvpA family protein [Thiothrix nivea]EIJ33953.1 Colicin V production protein [Thiothrix nivea DSM 5205]